MQANLKRNKTMPHIHVTAPQGSLNKSQQDALISQLSNAVLKAERAPIEDDGAQSLVWAYYHEQPEGTSYVGGKAIKEPPFRIAVTTPEGALNAETRNELVAEIGQIIDGTVGTFEGRLNHWAMLYEVAEGSWGGAGQVFSLAAIQSVMNINPAKAA